MFKCLNLQDKVSAFVGGQIVVHKTLFQLSGLGLKHLPGHPNIGGYITRLLSINAPAASFTAAYTSNLTKHQQASTTIETTEHIATLTMLEPVNRMAQCLYTYVLKEGRMTKIHTKIRAHTTSACNLRDCLG